MITEDKIRYFLAVASTKSVTRAAELNFVSQQAISKNLASLEEDLGFELFTRRGHRLSITPEGEKCCEIFSKMMKETSEQIEEVRRAYNSGGGKSVSIGIQSYLDFGNGLVDAFNILKESSPSTEFSMAREDPNMLVEKLMSDNVDIIIINRRFLPAVSNLKTKVISEIKMALMVSETHPQMTEDSTYESFTGLPFIADMLHDESMDDYNRRIDDEIERWNLKPASVVTTRDRDTAYTAAELGLGIVIGSQMSRMASGRRLKMYLMDQTEPVIAVWKQDSSKSLQKIINVFSRELNGSNQETEAEDNNQDAD